jgi:uncharacterized protein
MDELKCPRCEQPMQAMTQSELRVWKCPKGDGVFLDRAQLGSLIEAEHDWHINAGQDTAPMPRITPDMTQPPQPPPRARAWVETLFA